MSSATQPQSLSDADRFHLLLDAITDCAIYMLDRDGRVASWNSGAENITGYCAAEILGQQFAFFFAAEDQAKGVPARLLHDARLNGRSEAEGWQVRKDGSRFWAIALVHPVRDAGGEVIGYGMVSRDITERMASQEALRDSERRFRLLVDGVMDHAMYLLDPSGVVTSWNPGAERLKGYRADEIIGQHFARFYTREDRAAGLPARVLEAAAREGRYEAEGWRVRKDGGRFWASVVVNAIHDESGQLVGFAKITRDVTERRAAQEALRESERQLRLLIAGVVDYAIFMLDPNGIVASWNPGAARIKGYSAEEIVGQHFSRFYTEADRKAGIPARALQTAAETGRFEAEGWRVRKDGSLFWANTVIDAIRGDDRRIVGFAKITRDITEQRDAQIALQDAQAKREHAQKMEVLGHLTGGVAHDFNNLLMVVSGHLERLKRLVQHDAGGLHAAQAIDNAVRRGESLTRQLLTASRRQTLSPVVISLVERVESFRALIAGTVGVSVRLVAEIPPDIWPVEVDASEFELALLNTTLNARDAMPEGGVISIAAENVSLRPHDTPANLEGDFVALTIADTGCGIAADILPKVFDPYFTTKHASTGSGLGLAQVHGFAHQSGGTVTIDSELDKGTRVTLYLPRAHAEPERRPAGEAAHPSGNGRVLLVEDNPDVAEVGVLLLEQLGYQVMAADSARAALEVMERNAFDLVVSDIVMAGDMDGIGLAREIRRTRPELPVILVTGYRSDADFADTEFTVLRKPYKLADLGQAAAAAIAGARPPPPPGNLVQLDQVRRGPQRPKGP